MGEATGRIGAATGARGRAIPALSRLVSACLASVLLYAIAFGFVADRPLEYGFLRRQLDLKLARAALVGSPKLVILAGSNGPYSHRCETIEKIVRHPCINGGVAVGIGLDYLFARWERVLHPGDTVYLPMEEAQYVRTRAATALGPDAAIMFRHDWHTLAGLGPRRWLAAVFSFDLRDALMSGIETALVAGGFHDPRAAAEGRTNAWGDHTGHTPALGAAYRAVLARAHPFRATQAEIRSGYGTRLIVRFLRWCRAHGVRAIGGLPSEFRDDPMTPATRRAIRAVYRANGAPFLELPNRSLYPRADFFDTADHLSQPWQIVQSVAVGRALRGMVGRAPGLTGQPADCTDQYTARIPHGDEPHVRPSPAAAPVHPGNRRAQGASGRGCLEHPQSGAGGARLHRRQRLAEPRRIPGRTDGDRGLPAPQMGPRAGLSPD